MTYAYIVIGAIVGAPLRYFVQVRVTDLFPSSQFPWGTVLVNLTGCLLIGLLLGLTEERGALSREARLLLVTGFLGSYTTFSAFGWETYNLAKSDEVLRAAGNVFLSTVGGLAAVWAGAQLAKLG